MASDDWLRPPAARRPGDVLGRTHDGRAHDGGAPDHETSPAERTFDLLSAEHRDKLVTMFRLVAEGRRWEDVRDDVLAMFDLAPAGGAGPHGTAGREPAGAPGRDGVTGR